MHGTRRIKTDKCYSFFRVHLVLQNRRILCYLFQTILYTSLFSVCVRHAVHKTIINHDYEL
jgi:hypothetical protein